MVRITGMNSGLDTESIIKAYTSTHSKRVEDAKKQFMSPSDINEVDKEGNESPAEQILIWHLASMQSGLDYDLSRPGILRVLKEKGAKNFGIHAFLASNTVTNDYYPTLAKQLFEVAVRLQKEVGVHIAFINPFSVSVNDKKIINAVHKELDNMGKDMLQEQLTDLNVRIVEFLENLTQLTPYPVSFDPTVSLSGLLKLHDVFKVRGFYIARFW